ncbi:L-rhamnose/proton symporter RhaT [Bacteroidota bacterium]
MGAIFGIILHSIGGFAAASFYVPYTKVKDWAWVNYWLFGGIFSWIITPAFIALLAVENNFFILENTEFSTKFWTYLFGALWGIGGLTYGMSMRYLGLSLGNAVALGFCAIFGTLVPPIFEGRIMILFQDASGLWTFGGIIACFVGIGICGLAGAGKDKELVEDGSIIRTVKEFSMKKGFLVAFISGLLSACMAFGLAAGKPIAALSAEHGTSSLWQNSLVLVVILLGGFTTNFIWCGSMIVKNRSFGQFRDKKAPLKKNYIFSIIAGITWYLQFMFYGMGTTFMGKFDFASWTLHMAFIILFSNIWGFSFGEWKGTSHRTRSVMITGLIVIVLSTVLIGIGTYLGAG